MYAYKLFRLKKNGAITPLFINKTRELPMGIWMEAQSHETKGFALRPGWHCCTAPRAPHLSDNPKHENRVWLKVEIEDFEEVQRPESQGGKWYLAQKMRIPIQEALHHAMMTRYAS